MIKRFILSILPLILFTNTIHAQMVDDEWMGKAKELQAIYKNDDVVVLKATEKYSFEIDNNGKENSSVLAFKGVEEEFITLKDFQNIIFGDGYDTFSEIVDMTGEENYGRKYKKVALQVNEREEGSDDIFDHDSREKYLILPLKTMGMRYRGIYYKKFSDVRYLTTSYFVSSYPIIEKVIEIEIPSDIFIEVKEFNFDGYNIVKEENKNVKTGANTIRYTIKNVASKPFEKYMPSPGKVYPHIVFLARNYTDKNNVKHQLFENTQDQYKWYKSLVKQIENNDADLQPVLDKIIAGKTTDIEKIKAIYYWVQDNIKYVAFERGLAGFKPDAASLVCKNKFGDCKGMANLLTTLLKKAGYDARLTWIGTTDKPYDYSLQSLIVDNHMICALKFNNKTYFLDGTEKFIAFDDNATRIQGRQALIENGDENYLLEIVPIMPSDRNKISQIQKITIQQDKLISKFSTIYKGENLTSFLYGVNDIANNKKEKAINYFLSKGDKNIEVENVSVPSYTEREKPLQISYDAIINNKITLISNEMYVSIDWSKDLEEFILTDKRKNYLEINDNINREYKVELDIPLGYKVKELPKSLLIQKENFSIDIQYKQEDNKIILTKLINVKKQIKSPDSFKDWNADLKKLKETNNEQIIFIKES